MKILKIGCLLSLLTLLLSVGCNTENIAKPEAAAPTNDSIVGSETASPKPTSVLETAVPSPPTETTRTIRLTPVDPPQLEIEPTVAETAVVGEVPEAIMTAVYEDLTTIQNVPQAAITLIKAEAVIWRDGSLGCPQPGQVYTQALVNGYWVVLEGNGRTYDYHTSEIGTYILCQNGLPPSPPIGGTPNSY